MTPRRHVEQLAAGGSRYHAALLAHGRDFRGLTRSSAVRDATRWKDRVKPRWHRCFMNAGTFAVSHNLAEYWEGYWRYAAVDDPVHHAWVMLDGHLLDFTAEDVARRARRRGFDLLPPDEQEYFGVHVPTDLVRHRAEVTRVWGPVAELYLTATEGVAKLSTTNNQRRERGPDHHARHPDCGGGRMEVTPPHGFAKTVTVFVTVYPAQKGLKLTITVSSDAPAGPTRLDLN